MQWVLQHGFYVTFMLNPLVTFMWFPTSFFDFDRLVKCSRSGRCSNGRKIWISSFFIIISNAMALLILGTHTNTLWNCLKLWRSSNSGQERRKKGSLFPLILILILTLFPPNPNLNIAVTPAATRWRCSPQRRRCRRGSRKSSPKGLRLRRLSHPIPISNTWFQSPSMGCLLWRRRLVEERDRVGFLDVLSISASISSDVSVHVFAPLKKKFAADN